MADPYDRLDPYAGGWGPVDDNTAEEYGGTRGLNSFTLDGYSGPAAGIIGPLGPAPKGADLFGMDENTSREDSMNGIRGLGLPGLSPPSAPSFSAPVPGSAKESGPETWGQPMMLGGPKTDNWSSAAFGFDNPAQYGPAMGIPGMTEAIGTMKEGADTRAAVYGQYGTRPSARMAEEESMSYLNDQRALESMIGARQSFENSLPSWSSQAFGFTTPDVNLSGLPGIGPPTPERNSYRSGPPTPERNNARVASAPFSYTTPAFEAPPSLPTMNQRSMSWADEAFGFAGPAFGNSQATASLGLSAPSRSSAVAGYNSRSSASPMTGRQSVARSMASQPASMGWADNAFGFDTPSYGGSQSSFGGSGFSGSSSRSSFGGYGAGANDGKSVDNGFGAFGDGFGGW